ncbi:uncharacterized protein LOC135496484 [Lineus longissimus]|uniref:uncharacterized protein LOC135496484 n=1 Tax=Lineus longissimus TaxID=88925 RepID=UPI002B4F666E
MFPFLFVAVWKIVHGVKQEEREKMKERKKIEREGRNGAQTNGTVENTPKPVTPKKKKRPSTPQHKAWGVFTFSIIGLGVAILAIGTKYIIEYAFHTYRSADRLTWHPYSVNYTELYQIREENMKKYDFPYNRNGVDKRQKLSLTEFHDVYDGKWPVVVTDVVPKWAAFHWSKEFFTKYYGKDRTTMKAVSGDLARAEGLALPLELFAQHSHEGKPHTWTYIQDELFIPTRPHLKKDIGEAVYLMQDYYEEFPEPIRPWNAMLLWGTAYSRSALHIDPYNWTGTNAVLKGIKRWKLYPPVQDEHMYLYENRLSNFPLDCFKYNSPVDAFDPESVAKYPKFKNTKAIMFDQHPGELLIIPTGWFHQAYNVEETIAISSQVMNDNNYKIILEEIFKAGNLPRKSLPPNFYSLSPLHQVRVVMQQIPRKILDHGRDVTRKILKEINKVNSKNK